MVKFVYLLLLCCIIQLNLNLVNCGGPHGRVDNEELYKILGVSKTANTKEIRVAFKKIALEKHPDKNKEDPNANANFIRINRAYEILKDEELRKKYDQFGEDGLKDNQNQGNNYQSWNFYKQNFGIYDDDPEIITLTRSDFRQLVDSSDTIWFVNFYSTQCSHCHELAPTWRDLAKQLDGVVQIGAVNCMDDWHLCNEEQIHAFPSLIMYPKKQRFQDVKSFDNLLKFALSFANGNVYDISNVDRYTKQYKKNDEQPWVISYCLSNEEDEHTETELNYELNCLDELVQRKLAIMLFGLARVGSVNCNRNEAKEKICPVLKPKRSSPIMFYSKLPDVAGNKNDEAESSIEKHDLLTADYKKIVEKVLNFLPDVKELNQDEFKQALDNLRDKQKNEKPWLIQFVNDFKPGQDLELKKLPPILSKNYNFARVDCMKLAGEINCNKYQLSKYPTFILFKSASSINGGTVNMKDNWYEVYYGNRQTPQVLAAFVKENANSPVRTLTEFDVNTLGQQLAEEKKVGFFVDFFAPWCPPCMNLLPEFRKASKLDGAKSISFGTVDCTMNTRICEQFGIRSYPTTILYNGTTPHNFHGQHSANDINDFIQDILKPSVIILTYESFHRLVGNKPTGKIWLIDFYASWCGPCQQLAPEWRKLAKKMDSNIASVASIDCVIEQNLCAEQGIQSYPNIRIYPANTKGFTYHEQYNGWMRDANSLHQWAANYLPSKSHVLNQNTFEKLVLRNFAKENEDNEPWLIDFYAPWCGHCQVFAPVFESLASKMEGKIKCGKVNCQEHQYLCQLAGIQAYPTIRFYPLAPQSGLNWNSGEEIQQYDVNSLTNTINAKLKFYGYENKNKKNSSDKNAKTEL